MAISRSWIRRLFARKPRTLRKAAARYRPAAEALEDRLTPAYPPLTPLTGAANPFNGVTVGSHASPALGDVDGDGDLDAFVGAFNGTLLFFKNTGSATNPVYTQQTGTANPFNGIDVGDQSKPALGDVDRDGDLDVFVGELGGTLRYFRNNGTAISPAYAQVSGPANPFNGIDVGIASTPALGDVDGDGDLDAIVGASNGTLLFFRNQSVLPTLTFTPQTGAANPFNNIDVGFSSSPALGDVDGDGDTDLVVGQLNGALFSFRNTGTASSPLYVQQAGAANPFNGFTIGDVSAPTLADVDGDGDGDILVGVTDGTLLTFRNDAVPPAFTVTPLTGAANPFSSIDVGFASTPALGDVDDDGDLDAFVGAFDGALRYFRNTGTATNPVYTEQTGAANPFNAIDFGRDPKPALGDVDGDGDLDALVGAFDGALFFFRNTGTVTSPAYSFETGTNNPFNGVDVGFASKPALGDADGDGDLDALVGAEDGTLRYFRNAGTATSPLYVQQTAAANPFNGVDVGFDSAPALGDVDGDGDLDAVVGEEEGALRYFRNNAAPPTSFTPLTGAANPFNAIDVGRFSAPSLGNLDGDGDLDLVVGAEDGTLRYFKNTGSAANPAYTLQTGGANIFGGFDFGNDSAPALGDLDGDGDLDLVVGAADGTLRYLRNRGTTTNPEYEQLSGAANPFDLVNVGNASAPSLGDLDGDGDLDLVVGANDGLLRFFRNTGSAASAAYTQQTGTNNPFNGVDVGLFSAPTLRDLDGDGKLDALVGAFDGTLFYFRNAGTATSPVFTRQTGLANPFNGIAVGTHSTPALGDVDGDGDLDALVGESNGTLLFFRNDPMPPANYVPLTGTANPFNGIDVGFSSSPALGDVDGDGDLDAVVGTNDGTLRFFRNTGTATSPVYVQQTGAANPFNGVDVGSFSTPALGDVDGDGDRDLVVGAEDGTLRYFRNTGSATNPVYAQQTGAANPFNGVDVGIHSTPALGDVDGDGDLDALVGDAFGALFFFRNTGSATSPVFTRQTFAANPFNGVNVESFSTPVLEDVDGDGDLDAVVGEAFGGLCFFRNTGSATNPVYVEQTGTANPFNGVDVGIHSTPALGDVDGDGDLDALVGDAFGALFFFRNTGSATSPVFTRQTFAANPFNGVNVGSHSAPALGDVDGDGDLDALVGEDFGTLRFFRANRAPVLDNAIPDQTFRFPGAQSYPVPANTFLDQDNNLLLLSATLANGAALPAWLSFSPITRTFSGTPGPADASPLQIRVTADDGNGLRAFDEFQLTLVNASGSISGTVFDDFNGNGTRQAGEPGLPGFTVFLDTNINGTRDTAGATFISTDAPVALPDLSTVFSSLTVPGSVGTVTDVNLSFHLTHTFVGDLAIFLISPNNTRILLVNRVGGNGQNFGTTTTDTILDDQAATDLTSDAAPFVGSFRPSNPLAAFNGLAGAGNWRLEIQDQASGDVGTLIRWSLTITHVEPGVQTDASGNYTLANLSPGTYTVREILQSGFTQTAPAGGAHTVPLAAGQTATGRDFGNRTLLQVTSITPTNSGFNVLFNRPFDPSVLNLYDTQTGGLGAADVTLVGGSSGPVTGSLVLRPDNLGFTFLRTGGVLPTDTYTVTLRSAANGFKAASGDLLDGNADGTSGDNHTSTFSVVSTAVVVSIADFARGPGQAVNVPATSIGLPLSLSNANGVRNLTATVFFNPNLLLITGGTVAPGMPVGSTVSVNTSQPGRVVVLFNSPAPLAPGAAEFVRLTASVPNTAPYTSKQVLDVANVAINEPAIPARDDDGLHVVGYFGDTSGNAGYSALDAQRALRVAVGLDSGFAAYQLADPRVVADINANGQVNATDATRILQESIGIDAAQVPALPGVIPPIVPGGPDPYLNLPTDLVAARGGLLTAPVLLDRSVGLEGAELAISFDPKRLEVVDVQRGSLTGDFDLFAFNPGAGDGTLRVALGRSAGPIDDRGSGSVLAITFRVRADAPSGPTILNLRRAIGDTMTQLNESGLDLIPDPSDEAGDALDGIVRVGVRDLQPGESVDERKRRSEIGRRLLAAAGQALVDLVLTTPQPASVRREPLGAGIDNAPFVRKQSSGPVVSGLPLPSGEANCAREAMKADERGPLIDAVFMDIPASDKAFQPLGSKGR